MQIARLAIFLLLVAYFLSGCAPMRFSTEALTNGAQTANEEPVDLPTLIPVNESLSYFNLRSEFNSVIESSTLVFQNGSCSLSNFYDFPNEIFGDNSLDNLTTSSLGTENCRRLALADALKELNGGDCAAQTTSLTNQERSALQFDPNMTTLLSSVFPSLGQLNGATLSGSQLELKLSATCVCSLDITLPSVAGAQTSMSVPPNLSLCSAKFSNYADTPLTLATSAVKTKYGF